MLRRPDFIGTYRNDRRSGLNGDCHGHIWKVRAGARLKEPEMLGKCKEFGRFAIEFLRLQDKNSG